MKKRFIPALAALALAVPLGIGGLTVSAPVTATTAKAQTAADHYFSTCSVYVIWRCKSGHRDYIFHNGHNFGYTARALPFGSDGADHKAFDYLFNRLTSGTLTPEQMRHWSDGFNTIFPDGVRPPIPEYINVHEYLNNLHRELQGFQTGNTPEERLENFQDNCEEAGGANTQRFSFGLLDFARNQCRVETVAEDPTGGVDPDAPATIETFLVSFDPRPIPGDPSSPLNPGDPFSTFQPPLFQVTSLDGFGPGNENPWPIEEGEERQVISDHRDRIIELQEEVTAHDEAIATMLELQNMNSSAIRSNTASVSALNSRVDTFADDIRKNKAGIALAYAFPSSDLNYNESFRLSGGAGYFREEAAVAFGFTGRLSPGVTASGGVGLADGVSGARVEIGYGW